MIDRHSGHQLRALTSELQHWGHGEIDTWLESADDDHRSLVIEALQIADSGEMDYSVALLSTMLGNAGYWELVQVGTHPVTPYVAHGNITVDSWGTFRSQLTESGRDLLQRLIEERTA